MIDLSVLDLVPVREGGTVAAAMADAAALAQCAERAGYKRFWVAEHHAMDGIAGGAASGRPLGLPTVREYLYIGGLVVFPTLLGHGLMNRAVRFWRGQVVGVASNGQFLFSSLFAWLAFGEFPSRWFPLGAVLVVAGVWIVARKGRRDGPKGETGS